MNSEPYSFVITNQGENKIAYYELRIVDKEHEISTLSHKSINYSLSVNNSEYSKPQNLGNNRSYIYVGGSLDPNENDAFDLKLWVSDELQNNKRELKASIELTMYGDIPTRNYIIYETEDGNYISKTSIASHRITNQVPLRDGYIFLGWSSVENGIIEYEPNAIYDKKEGTILYAIWEKVLFY